MARLLGWLRPFLHCVVTLRPNIPSYRAYKDRSTHFRYLRKMERVREAWAGGGETVDPHPEPCVHELYRCRNLPEIKTILRQADQEWMEAFLECGGLVAIFDALSALGKEHVSSLGDIMPQLQCIECLKAVMTSDYGLGYMVSSRSEKFVNKLVLGGRS